MTRVSGVLGQKLGYDKHEERKKMKNRGNRWRRRWKGENETL